MNDRRRLALGLADKALELNPFSVLARYNRAQILMQEKRWDEAVVDLDKAISINPKFVQAVLARGHCNIERKELDAAERDFVAASKLDPTSQDVNYFLGSIQLAKGNLEDALKSFNRCLAMDPNHIHAIFQKGATLEALGRHDESMVEMERIAKMNSESVKKLMEPYVAPTLIGPDQDPDEKTFKMFLSTDDPPNQRRVFDYLRCADTDTRGSYFNAAVRMITSDRLDLSSKRIVLESLAAFVHFAEEFAKLRWRHAVALEADIQQLRAYLWLIQYLL